MLIDEHLGISLAWEDQQTTAGDQIWPTACYCMVQAKNGFYNLNGFFNQKKNVKILKFRFQHA